MTGILRFLKTTLVGGVLFLLPLLLTVGLIKKVIELRGSSAARRSEGRCRVAWSS